MSLTKDHRPATEGAIEVFWYRYSENGGVGEGFDRCCHAHKTPAEAAVCYRKLGKTLRDRSASVAHGVFIAPTHIHAGGPWHEAGEVVHARPFTFAQTEQALKESR